MKSKLLFLFLIFGIFLAGCSKEDCSLKDTTYEKYTYDEDTKSCVILKTIPKNVCGNGIEEDKETYCNCPKDITNLHPTKGCDGTLGLYLEKSCNDEKKCVLTQNVKVVSQTKNIEFKNNDLTFRSNFVLNNPYIQNTDDENIVQIELELIKTLTLGANIKNIVVKEIILEDPSAIILARVDYNQNVDMTSPFLLEKKITLSDITKYEKKESIKLKLVLSYTKEFLSSNGDVIKEEFKPAETLISSLGSWTIINPNLYEEKKK